MFITTLFPTEIPIVSYPIIRVAVVFLLVVHPFYKSPILFQAF